MGALRDCLNFFDLGSRDQTSHPMSTPNGSTDVHSRKDVPFLVEIATFNPP